MKKAQKPWIKLKEFMDQEDYDLINVLQQQCIRADQTALKLELDYKLGITSDQDTSSSTHHINEFMYFDGQQMIGYIGVCSFGGSGSSLEVNGMVHPEYRRQGIFKKLSELVLAEWKRRNLGSMLLLCDRESNAGQKFIGSTGAQYKHSEYEMYLMKDNLASIPRQFYGITLRKSTHADAFEIGRQNAIYFNDESVDEDMILPEEEEKRGMTIYLAEKDQHTIGKVHLQFTSSMGAIFGLGVLPEYRGKGFGRAILIMSIEKLQEMNANEIMLQVAADNANALNLYTSCGFSETSTMDYYEISADPLFKQ